MCGIVGYFNRSTVVSGSGNPSDRELLRRMTCRLTHRGPDEQGHYLDDHRRTVNGRCTGLGHTRLSIIDLAAGKQPMCNDDETIWITYNGEVFNYIELRNELKARGHHFRSNSDTEVILRLYEQYGPDCVTHLNGDFAFAIHDQRQNRLFMARDRMGVRPLFYTQKDGGLYFASEIKALLAVPEIKAEPDRVALEQIFTFWFPLAPQTPFKDIFELQPGHMLIADDSGVRSRAYWQLDYPDARDADDLDNRPEAQIADELRELLLDATRIRLRSDVPVGAYLSGGLDSSITTAAIQQFAPDRLRSFSVTFESDEFDESAFQQQMVQALGTSHEAVSCTAGDIGAMFPQVLEATERPVLRTAPAPLYALSGLVRQNGYKVVMTGEGADEVFAGYDIFKEAKIRRFCASQPASARRPLLFQRLYPYLPALQAQSQSYLQAFFGEDMADTSNPLYSHLPRFKTTSGAKAFFSPEMKSELAGYDALGDLADRLPEDFKRWHPLSQAQYIEAAHLLPGYILSSQGDRMAMANSIEGRFPFLDHRVVEFAARIPPKLKIRGLREKHILRESMKALLPDTINNRPKQPYRAPDSISFTGDNKPDYVEARLSPNELEEAGYFNADIVAKLVHKCERAKHIGFRENMAFVGILSTQIWHQRYIEQGDSLEYEGHECEEETNRSPELIANA